MEKFTISSNSREPIGPVINQFIANAEISASNSLSEKNNNRFIRADVPADEMETNCDNSTHNLSELPVSMNSFKISPLQIK